MSYLSTHTRDELPVGKPGVAACLAFADTTHGRETWIGLFNYFAENYAVSEARFSAYAILNDGRLALLWRDTSTQAQLFSHRVNDWLTDFRGNLVLTCETTGGRPCPPILQTYKAFRFADGSVTSQHAEGPVARGTTRLVEHWGYDLEPGYEHVEFIFQNHSVDHDDEIVIEFFGADGTPLNQRFATTLPPLGWRSFLLPDILPAVATALKQGRVSARIKHKINPQRPLYIVHRDGKFVLSHASGSTDTPLTKPRGLLARYPVSDKFLGEIYLAMPLGGQDDITAIVDNFFYPAETYPLVIQAFDEHGRTAGFDRSFAVVPPQGVIEITPDAVRTKFGLPSDFKGHAILAIGPGKDGLSPRGRITQTARVAGKKTGCMINGGYVMNTQAAAGDRGLGARRNRTFAPIWNDGAARTEMMLFNNSSFTDYMSSANYSLRVFGRAGEVAQMTRAIGGSQLQRTDLTALIADIVPKTQAEPLMWAEIRSLEAQIPGLYLNRTPGWTDLDHMFGG